MFPYLGERNAQVKGNILVPISLPTEAFILCYLWLNYNFHLYFLFEFLQAWLIHDITCVIKRFKTFRRSDNPRPHFIRARTSKLCHSSHMNGTANQNIWLSFTLNKARALASRPMDRCLLQTWIALTLALVLDLIFITCPWFMHSFNKDYSTKTKV